MDIANVRKREEAFRELSPAGQVIHVPWRRDRSISKEDLEAVAKQLPAPENTMVLCGAGEIGQQMAAHLWERKMMPEAMAVVDTFEGAQKYPVSIYEQNLREMARIIYEQLKKQVRQGSKWQAQRTEVAGLYGDCRIYEL